MNSMTLLSLWFRQFPGWNPSFQFRIHSEFSHIETIPAASPALALVSRKSVNPSPYLCCPLFRILPNRPKPLIASLEQEFTQCGFRPEIPKLGE